MRRLILVVLLGQLTVAEWSPSVVRAADALPTPTGEIILTVSGKIERTNDGAAATFDRDMLESLGLTTIRTSTIWTRGVSEFEGVLVRDLLTAVGGAKKSSVTAGALDGYTITIPIKDFFDYPVILALRMDGRELSMRGKGPIWIVYPRDDYPELNDARYDTRWVWRLNTLVVK